MPVPSTRPDKVTKADFLEHATAINTLEGQITAGSGAGFTVVEALGSDLDDRAQLVTAFAAATTTDTVKLVGDFLVSARIDLPHNLRRIDLTQATLTHTAYTTSLKNNTLGLAEHPSDPFNDEDLVGNSTDDKYYRDNVFYRAGTVDTADAQSIVAPFLAADQTIVPRNTSLIYLTSAPLFAAGDWVVVKSEDATAFNTPSEKQGFLRLVMDITDNGDTTWTVRLDRKFPANLTVAGAEVVPVTLAPPVDIIGGTFQHLYPYRMFSAFIRMEFVERPQITDATFLNGGGNAVQLVGAVGGTVQGHAEDLLDDHDGSRYGYYSNPSLNQGHTGTGFTCSGFNRDVLYDVTATRVRHAFSTGPVTNPHFNGVGAARNLLNGYGEPESITVRGHGWNTGGVCWDTHEQGWDIMFDGVITTNAGRWSDEGTADSNEAGAGCDDRAKRTLWLAPRIINPAGSGFIVANIDRPSQPLDLSPVIINPIIIGASTSGIRLESAARIINPIIQRGGADITYGIFINSSSTGHSVILGGRIDLETGAGQCIGGGGTGPMPYIGGGIVLANADRGIHLAAHTSPKLPGDVIFENITTTAGRRFTVTTTGVIARKTHPFMPAVRVASGPQATTPLTEAVAQEWKVGDEFYYTDPAAGGSRGLVCTTAGTPGTWKTFGAISA